MQQEMVSGKVKHFKQQHVAACSKFLRMWNVCVGYKRRHQRQVYSSAPSAADSSTAENMPKDIFPSVTEMVAQNLGDKKGLISNDNIENKWKIGTLVKIKKRSFCKYFKQRPKYTCLNPTLGDIVEEKITLGTQSEILVEDFCKSYFNAFSIEAGGDTQTMIPGGPAIESTAGAFSGKSVSSVNLRNESIKEEDLRELFRKDAIKFNTNAVKNLDLKEGEKLAFVKMRAYNNNKVVCKSNTAASVSLRGKFMKLFSILPGSKGEVTTFAVPEDTVFAFGLQRVTLKDGYLKINPKRTIKTQEFTFSFQQLQLISFLLLICTFILPLCPPIFKTLMMIEKFEQGPTVPTPAIEGPISEIKREEKTLKPLADVQEATRRSLMKSLTEILDDKEALTLLEDTLDQCADDKYQPPQSKAVASFMDLLHKSKTSREMNEVLHLLVSALNALPGNLAALLARSDLKTLNYLMGMMDSLGTGQSKHPESPPPPLQKEGELHLVAEFIMSANDLGELKKNWDNPLITPKGLIKLLYISVSGLSLMQSK